MKLGALDISTVKLGTNQVQAVYQGGNLVWQNAPVATAATGVGQTSFTANWNAYTGAVVYLLDVSVSSDFSTFVYEDQQVNAPSTSYVVIGLDPNTTYYYRVRASTEALFDPDAQAFFDRVTDAEGSLSTTEQDAVNTLVVQMKADGIWSKMKAIYPMVGASAAACAQNLKSASFTGSFSSGWTFSSTGVKGNGSSTFFNTNFISSAELTLTSGSYSFYSRTDVNEESIDMAVLSTTNSIHQIITRLANTQYFYYRSSNANVNIPSANSLGHYILNRNSSTNTLGFKNGVEVWNEVQTAGLPTESIYLGARNQSGVGVIPTSREYAFASCGDGLTDTEASNFYTAVQTFNTTLSRQV